MHFSKLHFALAAIFTSAHSTPADDMYRSQVDITLVANIIDASLNNSKPLNTSSMIQTLGYQIGASIANLATNSSSPSVAPSQVTDQSSTNYDPPYFLYIDSILTLSEALIRRGQVPHGEANFPVYTQLQGLYNVIQTYGFQLGNDGKISRTATIRTLTAGNSLVDAESVWARNTSVTQTSTRRRVVRRAIHR